MYKDNPNKNRQDLVETRQPTQRAAMYVRMSTDHQKYSTENQADAIRDYAARRNMEIIKTYEDAGKSGLKLDGRDALKQLIADVQSESAEFKVILVLDVTRWGRFQDADESAYYEYICRRAGIEVQYVAEQFENDGSPVSTIVKGVKRAMAGEYSRELSAKVFAGQCRLIERGYKQGGTSGYLRSHLIDPSLLRADQFDAFMEDRQKRLLGLIEAAMGKSAYSGNVPEEGEDIEETEDTSEAELSLPIARGTAAYLRHSSS